MPHFSDDDASGAAAATSARSSSRIGRRGGGCLAKNFSTGAPKSARGPTVLGAGFRAAEPVFLRTAGAAFFRDGERVFFTPRMVPRRDHPRRRRRDPGRATLVSWS